MKKINILFCLFICNSIFCQIKDSSFSFILNCQFDKAISSYEKKIKKYKYTDNLEKALDNYNLACAYSLNNNEKRAFENLQKCFQIDSTFKNDFFLDPDFFNLLNKNSWNKFLLDNRPSMYSKFNDTLFINLSKIAIQDQAFYKKLNYEEKKYGVKSREVENIWSIKHALNCYNLLLIENYMKDSLIVFSEKTVGKKFANKCFLVIQHSDSATMEKYLPIIKKLYEKGETKGENYALLYDRTSLSKSKGKQYYGTQVNASANLPYPIIDENNLDKRRKELGMEPIKDYLLKFGIIYKSKK